MIVAAWDGKPDSFRASVLRGMMHFVELYHGEFSEERLVRALGSVHPMEIYRVGRDNPAKLPGFTWASTYKGASFERRQAILKQFIKEVRVGRDYNIEIVLNVPLDEFEEFKRHAASAGRGKNQKNKSQNPQKVGRCTSNAGIVVLDKTAGETISIVPKNAAHAILRC